MATKPTQSIFPIENGKLTTVLDCNNLQLINLDESNLEGGGGNGNGAAHTVTFVGSYSGDVITADQAVFLDGDLGATISGGVLSEGTFIVLVTSPTVVQISESVSADSGITFTFDRIAGNDTGTTTAILKGDGDHGFDDAAADVDYATPAAVALREPLLPTTSIDAQLLARHDVGTGSGWFYIDPAAIGGNDTGSSTAILKGDGTGGFDDALAGTDYATPASVALKVSQTDFDTYVAANDDAVALKADADDVADALDLKADTTALTAGLATKEPLLPTSPTDGWILSGNTDDTKAWVDPVTLGTSNQTFTDGASNTDTSWNSDQANFVSPDDVGLSISGTNIAVGTKIASVTDENTIVLDTPTTGTGTALTFTIYNRLSLAVGGGTVTSVAVNSTAVNDLLTVNVTNPTTSPTIALTKPSVSANTFYGSNVVGTPSFLSAGLTRTALGGTTVGQAIFQITGLPAGVASWLRMNADNTTVTARNAANTLSDLGAETTLTVSAPLARGVLVGPNNLSIPSATGAADNSNQRDGYLTGADHSILARAVPNTLTLNTTAPLTIATVSDTPVTLSTNRVIAMPSATGLADGTQQRDGYLTGIDHTLFINKPPNSRSLSVTAPLTMSPGTISPGPPIVVTGDLSANRSIAIPKADATHDGYLAMGDFINFSSGGVVQQPTVNQGTPVGTITISPTANPPTNRVILNAVFAQDMNINLPPAVNYPNATGIEIIDITTGAMATKGLTITKFGTDGSIDGSSTPITVPRGSGYLRLISNGGSGSSGKWTTAKYFVDAFKDPSDGTKKVTVSFSNWSTQPTGTAWNLRFPPTADSVTVVPRNNAGEVLRSLSSDGVLSGSPVIPTEIIPNVFPIIDGTVNVVITPNNGTIDTIKLNATLTGIRLYTFPNADFYQPGAAIRFYDAVGSPSAANNLFARVVSNDGNSFNGNPTIDITEPFFNRIFVSDGTSNWTVSTFGGTSGSGLALDLWHPLTAAATTTITCSANVAENHHIVTMTGATTLIMSGATPGQTGRIKFRDTNGGNHVVTVPNSQGKTPNAGGVGLFTISTGASVEDEYGWDYDGSFYNFYPLGLNMVAAAAPTFITASEDTTTAQSTSNFTYLGNVTNQRLTASRMVANGGVLTPITDGSVYTIGKIVARMAQNSGATVTYGLYCSIWSSVWNGTSHIPDLQLPTESSLVAGSSVPVFGAEGDVTFDTNVPFVLIGPRVVTGVTMDGTTTITKTGGFQAGDVGTLITGTGIAANAVILSVGASNNTATLSVVATAGTNITVTIKHVYFIVMRTDATVANPNTVGWASHDLTVPGAGRPIYFRKQASGGSWANISNVGQFKYITYK